MEAATLMAMTPAATRCGQIAINHLQAEARNASMARAYHGGHDLKSVRGRLSPSVPKQRMHGTCYHAGRFDPKDRGRRGDERPAR
jgi:hypothetical protein